MPRISRPWRAIGGVALVMLVSSVAASGAAGAASKAGKAPAKVAAPKRAVPSTFPSIKVIDLATAKTVDLGSLNATTKPQLVWFWAPT